MTTEVAGMPHIPPLEMVLSLTSRWEREAPQAFLEQCETGVSHCLQRALSSGVVNLAPKTDGTVAVGRFLLGEKLPNRVLRTPMQHCGVTKLASCKKC